MKYTSLVNGIIMAFTLSFMVSGCAQKTTVKALKSAKVSDKSIKNIGIASFENDNIAQASQIDSAISNLIINGQKYFNVVDRKNIDTIMQEKKLNDSGLVDLIKGNDTSTGLKQMETLVTGKVEVDEMSSSRFLESRVDYSNCIRYEKTAKGKTYCAAYRRYNVSCKANTYNVKTKVKLIKIADASTIFAQTYEASTKYKHCLDDKVVLPTKHEVNSKLAANISQQLVKDIAPSYVYFRVTLLDDVELKLNDAQEKSFKTALNLIKLQRIQKAHDILDALNKELGSQSYVVLYNLGVTTEALGDVKEAYTFFKKSEDIALVKEGVVEEISYAITRAKKNIAELEKASKQL